MKKIVSLLFSLFTYAAFCQFNIGHTTITFNDPGRSGGYGSGGGPGRQIQTEVYYPADVAGDDVALTSGEFPLIIFGHGFVMAWDAYENIWEALVPDGYIIAFPRTEGSLSPDHEEYGMDLALVAADLQQLNDSSSSLFYNHLINKTAIMGHSMGGGATFLAAENNTNITTVIGLAPAETTPSAISASQNVTVPALVFSADEDMVTPAVDHHSPIYSGLSSTCKYFINIVGGAHCYYANSNFNCDFGESTSGGNISISRQEQQDIMFRYITPWLNMYLKDECNASSVFENDLQQDNDVTYQSSCSAFPSPNYNLNVSTNAATLSSDENGTTYQWLDCTNNFAVIPGATNQSYTATASGEYAVILGSGACSDTTSCYTVQLTTSSIDTDFIQFNLYPNPSNGNFSIETDVPGYLQVYSSIGSVVYRSHLIAGEENLNLQLAKGTYLVEFKAEHKSIIKRLVVLP